LANAPLKVLFAEFFGNFDSNAMKKRWLNGLGYQDITPALPGAGPGLVATFSNKPAIAKWPDFQAAVTNLEPDWLYISGHHARKFKADLDDPPHRAVQKETGFFNQAYHDRTWHKNFADPNEDFEIYMTTTRAPTGALAGDDNPFFAKVHSACKGVLLMGCNSFAYPAGRVAWAQFFPSALIIGHLSKTKGGEKWIQPFLMDSICNDAFFRKPPATEAELAEAAYNINRAHVLPGLLRLQRGHVFAEYDAKKRTATAINVDDSSRNATFPKPK
jgi:hypothetical protein